MKVLSMKPSQFGSAVSGYAFSAGIAGLLTAGVADRFDRKKLLLFFYIGFIAGTVLCALATSYENRALSCQPVGMAYTVLARSKYGYVDSGYDRCKTKTSNCAPCSTTRPFTASPFTKYLLKKKLPHWLFSHGLSVYLWIYDDAL
jgi:MFS family permease